MKKNYTNYWGIHKKRQGQNDPAFLKNIQIIHINILNAKR